MKKILVVDGLNFIMRARYSVPVWMQQDPNGVVYTFFRSLRAQVADHTPDKVYFVLEGRPMARLAEHALARVHRDDRAAGEHRRVDLRLLVVE